MRLQRQSALVATALVALLAGAPAAAPARAQDKATLRLNLKGGESYTLSTTSEQQITQTIGGNAQKIDQTIGFAFTLKPAKVDPDGTIHGTYTYDAVRMKSNGLGAAVDYDSARDKEAPANPMTKAFAALVGQKLEVVMTARGELKELKGADQLLAAIVKAMDLPAEQREVVEQQMQGQFGEEALKSNFEQMTAVYPDKPVAVGDSWDVKQTITAGMPMTLNTTYTLKALEGGKATLDVKGTVKTDPDAPAGVVPGAKFGLEGGQNGSLVLDVATGWLSSGNLKQNLEGKMSLDAGGQKMEIPMKIVSDTTLAPATDAKSGDAKPADAKSDGAKSGQAKQARSA